MQLFLHNTNRHIELDDRLVERWNRHCSIPIKEHLFENQLKTEFGHYPTQKELSDADLSNLCNEILNYIFEKNYFRFVISKRITPYVATVVKYVDGVEVAKESGTFDQIAKVPHFFSASDKAYFKFDRYNDLSNEYVEMEHFGCKCRKKGGLKISEGIVCNGLLNNWIRWLNNNQLTPNSFYYIIRFLMTYRYSIKAPAHIDDFIKWVHDFFDESLWREVKDLSTCRANGIYALILDEYAKCYIGQSNDIRTRITQHWAKDKFETTGIDLFRAKDTTRIFTYPCTRDDADISEWYWVDQIPKEYRLNMLQGGTISFHEKTNSGILFDDFYDNHEWYRKNRSLELETIKNESFLNTEKTHGFE